MVGFFVHKNYPQMVGSLAWPQKTSFRYVESQDLSHAEDEVTFYEEALALKRQPGVAGRASGMGNDSEMMGRIIF